VSGKSREGEYKRTIVKVSKLTDDIKTGGHNYPRDKLIGNLFTGWAVSGIEMARARFRRFNGTVGTQHRDIKGGRQVKKSEMQSTGSRHHSVGDAEIQTLARTQDESYFLACGHKAKTDKHVRALVRTWGVFG